MSDQEPGSTRVSVVRRFAVSQERLFDAWLDREGLSHWLFATPDGHMERVEIDPRPGGHFRIDERRGDSTARHFGTFVELDRPARIIFDFATDRESSPTRVTVEIKGDGSGSRLTLGHELAPEWADQIEKIEAGWSTILDGLAATLVTHSD